MASPGNTNDPMLQDSDNLMERFLRGCAKVESNPHNAVGLLESVQQDVRALALFSPNDESIDDISTKSIRFLSVEHFLAMALVGLPTAPGKMTQRKRIILRSLELWASYLTNLEKLELLTADEAKEFRELLEENNSTSDINPQRMPPGPNREAKIARFKAKKQMQNEIQRLAALRERRQRYGISAEEEMDGHDEEGLERTVVLKQLEMNKGEAFENWSQAQRELPMIEMMSKMEEERQEMQRRTGTSTEADDRAKQPLSGKPLQLTHITKTAAGALQVKKEEIRSKVFRPGWNQPTMSLEELGEREYQAAVERDARQKEADANRANEPKRYEDLLRDGMEDNVDLVDASAKLDRDWDDWKDENPRGSGNKNANRGDKNF
eukprot:Nitzschia sp. Nitz4//scaffold131_size63436//16724//17860//NITZ4_006268-RA/size63436-processed-gene-0.114-mRNA-1//-1//CDS//3329535247//4891//frame0